MIDQLPVCDYDQDSILYSQCVDTNLHLITNLKSPVNRFHAVNKAYTDRIKYKTAVGNISNTVMTYHTLLPFPTAKAFVTVVIKQAYVKNDASDMSVYGVSANAVKVVNLTFKMNVKYSHVDLL